MEKLHIFTFCCALGLSTAAFAYSEYPFYVSADAGFFHGSFNQTYNDQTATIPQNFSSTEEQQGYTSGVALGYSKLVKQQYLLGLELSGNLASHASTYSASNPSFTDKTQIKHYVDFSFVPGFLLNDSTALYAKLGISRAEIQDTLTSPAGYNAVSTEYTSSGSRTGFVGGLGVKKFLTNQFAVFAEGDYRDYGSMSFNGFQNISTSYTHTATITAYNAVFGAAYYF